MEYVAIDKEALNSLNAQIHHLLLYVDGHNTSAEENLESVWIENKELACRLNLSLRTLQTYRERGILGFSVIERKIYYKISEIQALINSGLITTRNKKLQR